MKIKDFILIIFGVGFISLISWLIVIPSFKAEGYVFKYNLITEDGVYQFDEYTIYPSSSPFANCISWATPNFPFIFATRSVPFCKRFDLEKIK